MAKKHVIWSNLELNPQDWIDGFLECNPEYETADEHEVEDAVWGWMVDLNWEYLDDERLNLNVPLPRDILVIADLGLWDGRHCGYKIIPGNINECLNFGDGDYGEWWVDGHNQLRGTECHHDGTNHYLYRGIKPDASEEALDKLLDNLYDGKVSRSQLSRVTYPLGGKVKEVYGWS